MSTINDTLRELSEGIGPRPACSDSERSAAEYLDKEFKAIGLPSKIQDFYSSTGVTLARGLYSLIFIAVFALLGFFRHITGLAIALLILLVLVVVASYLELNGVSILNRLFRKGPSQNVVARFKPRLSTAANPKKVVLVAHYDTCLVTPLASQEKVFPTIAAINRYIFIAFPILSLLLLIPKFKWLIPAQPWIFYVLLALCLVPLVMFFDAFATVFIKRYSPGANNNASGVAAMLEAARKLTEGKIADDAIPAQAKAPAAHTASEGDEKATNDDIPEDFDWVDGRGNSLKPRNVLSARMASGGADRAPLALDTIDFGVPSSDLPQETISFAPVSSYDLHDDEDDIFNLKDVLGADLVGSSNSYDSPRFERVADSLSILDKIKALFSFKSTKKRGSQADTASDDDGLAWLGLDDDFNARKKGKDIGSWDNFGGESDDDDGFAWKGGSAGGDFEGDDLYAVEQAARIRAKILDRFDGSVDDKEIWFVATGAQCQNSSGMDAFLEEFGPELSDAFFINVDAVGSGSLFWRLEEGRNRLHKASPRLISIARRVARNEEIRAKAARKGGVDTDATLALRAGYRAITITRLGSALAPINRCSESDRFGQVDIAAVEETARFVTSMVKEL